MSALLPVAVSLGLASSVLAAEGSYLVSARAETRARSALPGDRSAVALAGDLEVLPRVSGRLRVEAFSFELGYLPSLVVRDFGGRGLVLPLHRGSAAVQWERDATVLRLATDAASGVTDLGPLLLADPGVVAGQLSAGTTIGLVQIVRSTTTASLQGRAGAHLLWRGEGSYQVSGSTQTDQLPLGWGPGGLALLGWEPTRVDRFTTTATVRQTTFMTGHQQLIGELTETWTRALSRQLSLEGGGGVAVVNQRFPPPAVGVSGREAFEVQPVAVVVLTSKVPIRRSVLELGGRASLAPFADRFTATVYERLSVSGRAMWVFERDLATIVIISVARSFPGPALMMAPDFLVTAEATLAWTATPWLILGASLRGAHIALLTPVPSSQNQWLASVSVAFQRQDSASW